MSVEQRKASNFRGAEDTALLGNVSKKYGGVDGFMKHMAGLAGFIYEDANDSTKEELEKAAHNFKQLEDGWCNCKYETPRAYFRNPNTGFHGWVCVVCKKTWQVG